MIPAAVRQRSYDALFEGGLVTLRTGTFLEGAVCTDGSGLGCHQFRLALASENVHVTVTNPGEFHGGQIVEYVSQVGWLELTGTGSGRVDGTTIRASLNANIWYCPSTASSPFPCSGSVSCKVPNLEMTIAPLQR